MKSGYSKMLASVTFSGKICLPLFLLSVSTVIKHTEAQNFALNQPTEHAGTYGKNEGLYGSRFAADGDNRSYTRTETGDNSIPAWWQVSLESDVMIQYVTIIAPHEASACRYLESFEVTLETIYGESIMCSTFSNNSVIKPLLRIELPCPDLPTARTIVITRTEGYQSQFLAMAEVIVTGILLSGNQALEKATQFLQYPSISSESSVDRDGRKTCSSVASSSEVETWQVDLGNIYYIRTVSIFVAGQARPSDYSTNLEITVDYTNISDSRRMCANCICNETNTDGDLDVQLDCTTVLQGRYVTIRRKKGYLALCDVQIYGDYLYVKNQTRLAVTKSTATTNMSTLPVISSNQTQSSTKGTQLTLTTMPTIDGITSSTTQYDRCSQDCSNCRSDSDRQAEESNKSDSGVYVGIGIIAALLGVSLICNIVLLISRLNVLKGNCPVSGDNKRNQTERSKSIISVSTDTQTMSSVGLYLNTLERSLPPIADGPYDTIEVPASKSYYSPMDEAGTYLQPKQQYTILDLLNDSPHRDVST